MGVVTSHHTTTLPTDQSIRHWRLNLIQLSSQALGKYFSTRDERHLRIYKAIVQLLGGDDDSQ